MLKCADKKGLAIQGNGQFYKFVKGDEIPERIFTQDFPGENGKIFLDALIANGRIENVKKETKKESEAKKS